MRQLRSLYHLLGNRRKFERTPFSGVILMTAGYAIVTTHVCSCADISPRGIGIGCSESIPVDEVVALHSDVEGPRRLARVRHCQQHGPIYRIGLEFMPDAHQGG
jgi:hypothetical protein